MAGKKGMHKSRVKKPIELKKEEVKEEVIIPQKRRKFGESLRKKNPNGCGRRQFGESLKNRK